MKKIFFLVTMTTVVMTACTNNASEYATPQTPDPAQVTLTFSPYQMEAMTRAATSISDVVTRLDVWIYQDDIEAAAVHQSASDTGFGSFAVTLDKTKTYTIYAVGHKASAACTLADGLISFADGKVTQAMWYTQTFSPAETTSLSCLMTRIVGMFRLETTDPVPDDVERMSITIGGALSQWNIAGYGTTPADRTTNFSSITRIADGTAGFSAYAIATDDAPMQYTITVAAYLQDGTVRQQRAFEGVPLRNGYKTTYRGEFFTNRNTQGDFTVESDWQEYEVTKF